MAERAEETIIEPSGNQLSLERTILSHERTLMSWVRTATSLITFGFTIYKFFQLELQNRPPLQGVIGPRQFAILMISIGLFSLIGAAIQYRVYRNGLRRWYPGTPPLSLVGVVAALVSLLGLLALVAVMFRM
jgi:putative membrane protein